MVGPHAGNPPPRTRCCNPCRRKRQKTRSVGGRLQLSEARFSKIERFRTCFDKRAEIRRCGACRLRSAALRPQLLRKASAYCTVDIHDAVTMEQTHSFLRTEGDDSHIFHIDSMTTMRRWCAASCSAKRQPLVPS